jgi:hypothetical protein
MPLQGLVKQNEPNCPLRPNAGLNGPPASDENLTKPKWELHRLLARKRRNFEMTLSLIRTCAIQTTATFLAFFLIGAAAQNLCAQSQTPSQPPSPARSASEEMLTRWNDIGNKLVAMAQDFPEDKYDYKLQKDERTFALNLLHAAALDFVLIRRISDRISAPTSARAIIPHATSSRARPTWSSSCRRPSPTGQR